MKRLLLLSLLLAVLFWPGGRRPAAAQSIAAPDDSLGRPSVDAGDYLYVSGQGPRRADGTIPAKFSDQVRQCLDNVKHRVEAAGLGVDHLVYTQVYLEDVTHYAELNQVFADYFEKDPPARGVLGVARVPDTALLINAVAVRDLAGRQAVSVPNWPASKGFSAGMLTRDRLFISTMPGSDPATGAVPAGPAAQVDLALDRLSAVLGTAGLSNANMVFVNPYLTSAIPMRVMNEHYARRFEFGNTPGRATIKVSSLPEGAQIAYTGVAVRDLKQRKAVRPKNMPPSPTASPCVFAGDTLFCSAKDGFIPGPNGGIYAASTADQTRQTMRNLLDNLEEADMSFDEVVSTTIYLDDLSDTPLFRNVYKKYFKGALPAETTVEQLRPGDRKLEDEVHYPALEQVSLIAVRSKGRPAN